MRTRTHSPDEPRGDGVRAVLDPDRVAIAAAEVLLDELGSIATSGSRMDAMSASTRGARPRLTFLMVSSTNDCLALEQSPSRRLRTKTACSMARLSAPLAASVSPFTPSRRPRWCVALWLTSARWRGRPRRRAIAAPNGPIVRGSSRRRSAHEDCRCSHRPHGLVTRVPARSPGGAHRDPRERRTRCSHAERAGFAPRARGSRPGLARLSRRRS
jgi:hypothetical protein